jgi:hypothetical protein
MSTSNQPSMRAVSSVWGDAKTFRFIPITEDCPYLEAIYAPDTKILVLISKVIKTSYHMVPVLDDHGDPIPAKKKRPNGKNFKEERKAMETFQEYYILDQNEQIQFINMICENAEEYDYMTYLTAEKPFPAVEVPEGVKMELVKEETE